MPIAAVLCVFSIIYGGFVAYYAKDTKYVIGYSSSSHMGYVFLGMAALDYISLSGAVHLHVRSRHGHGDVVRDGRVGL